MTAHAVAPAPVELPFLPVMTPVLRALVTQYQAQLPADDFAAFVDYLKAMHAQLHQQLAPLAPGPARARAVHALLEPELAKVTVDTKCRKGCSACCHLEVEITKDEGELLAEVVMAGHRIDEARLQLQAARERRSAEWAQMVHLPNRCVFLGEDGACTVYAHRPGSCRKHLVVTHPVECATKGGKPEAVTVPVAELILSTALSLADNPYSSLSKSTVAGLNKLRAK